MYYESHDLNSRLLPFIFHYDVIRAGRDDYTHWHENIEILYIKEGKGSIVCDFHRYDAAAGDIFVINSEVLHLTQSDDVVRYYCFIIDNSFCAENGIMTQNAQYETKINDPLVSKKFDDLIASYAKQGNYREAGIRLAALGLLLSVAENHVVSEVNRINVNPHIQNIKKAIMYIKENFHNNINVDDITAISGLSRSYFSSEFKEITDFTILNYLNLVRCQNACKLLRSGKYRVNEAAAECGFNNLSYFARTYKKIMGILPSEERAEIPK